MAHQKNIFFNGEGDQWFLRNRNNLLGSSDIIKAITSTNIIPKKVLEIGCSNGYILNDINKLFNCECYGIEPSVIAIADGKKFNNINLQVGTADNLPFEDNSFDVIIFGFCLYLCDRKDLFKIAYEADRCLNSGGFIIIKDFFVSKPYKNAYKHKEGVYSYKMDYSKMFSWNPSYNLISNTILNDDDIADNKISIAVLNKL